MHWAVSVWHAVERTALDVFTTGTARDQFVEPLAMDFHDSFGLPTSALTAF